MRTLPFDIGSTPEDVLDVVRRYWGFDGLLPLQGDAIRAGLEQRDSLVVLPTGGGKSLCYQVPPLLTGRTDVVVSPLISLMKDQVDGLRANGYPAAALHSAQDRGRRQEARRFLESGDCRLVFVSPERLVMPWFLETIERLGVTTFAVDEAHCISHWGHDFRPEYRQLAVLKERIPGASVHAYTATATARVRSDIVEQLGLDDPTVLVGRFDRPNLIYRLVPRLKLRRQVRRVLARHVDEAAIVYCVSRADTERLAMHLAERGHRVAFYHAGLDREERRRTQEAFAGEELDVIVATVAFGMGIDRSDVRCVIHAAMPKSVEHYQQEAGRAGRDGLEAECVMFWSPGDAIRWESLLERTADETASPPPAGIPPEVHEDALPDDAADDRDPALELLDEMRRFCQPGRCRHRALTEYFGQEYEPPEDQEEGCGACDVCLGETEGYEDGTEAARMILSCIARVGQSFGMGHVVDVLRGADTRQIRSKGHDELSTWGLMKDRDRKELMNLVFQLIDQGLLERTDGDYPLLKLNAASVEVMRGGRDVQLMPVKARRATRTTAREEESWEGVDRELFDSLRELRTSLARERGVPAYVIFSDASLREMARHRPSSRDEFLDIHGVGEKKLEDLGEPFLACIAAHGGDRS